jgi:ACR3 family arsenite efflux pump ArsB
MSLVIWILIGTLALKVIWNFGVPYALLRLPINDQSGKKSGISPMLEIEIIIMILAIILSWLSDGESFVNKPNQILLYGVPAILLSYLHFFVVGFIRNHITKK